MWAPLEDVSSYVWNGQQVLPWHALEFQLLIEQGSGYRSCLCTVQKNAFCLEIRHGEGREVQYWVRIPQGLTLCLGKYWKAKLKSPLTWFITTLKSQLSSCTLFPIPELFERTAVWGYMHFQLHNISSKWLELKSFIVRWFLAPFWFVLFVHLFPPDFLLLPKTTTPWKLFPFFERCGSPTVESGTSSDAHCVWAKACPPDCQLGMSRAQLSQKCMRELFQSLKMSFP